MSKRKAKFYIWKRFNFNFFNFILNDIHLRPPKYHGMFKLHANSKNLFFSNFKVQSNTVTYDETEAIINTKIKNIQMGGIQTRDNKKATRSTKLRLCTGPKKGQTTRVYFCKRRFPRHEPVTSWSHHTSYAKVPFKLVTV